MNTKTQTIMDHIIIIFRPNRSDKFPPIKLANTPTSALVPIIAPVIPADTPFTVVK